MADKSIGELPQAQKVLPESLIPLEQDGQAMRMSGEQFSDFAKESVSPLAQQAEDSANTATEAANTAEAARDSIVLDEQKMAQAVKDAAGSAESAKTAAESAADSAEQARSSALASESSFMQAQLVAQDVEDAKKAAQMSAGSAGTAQMYAQSAADRAENAAGTVESIVAGNEAYTKRESDLRFAVPIVEGASGEVIAVTDSAERPLQGLKVFGKTTQDGTPSPDAPVELVSVGDDGDVGVTVCGKNLLDLENPFNRKRTYSLNEISETLTPNEIRLCGVTEVVLAYNESVYLMPKGTYTLSVKKERNNDNVRDSVLLMTRRVFDEPETEELLKWINRNDNSVTFTIPAPRYVYIRFHITGATGTNGEYFDVRYYDIQLEANDIATEFEPYKPAQTLTVSAPNGLPGIPVSSGGNYTDENGQQWICDEVDFARGVYVQRVKTDTLVDVNGCSLSYNDAPKQRLRIDKYTDGLLPYDSETVAVIRCSHYKAVTATNTWFGSADGIGVQGRTGNGGVNSYQVYIYDSNKATMDDWDAFFKAQYAAGTPVTIQYALATPVETPLTAEELAQYAALHTNYPNTTVFNDADASMEVKYAADTKMYIDNKFAQLAAAIVNNT